MRRPAPAELTHAARALVLCILRRFDEDGDGCLDFAELNAFQEACGDAERVASPDDLAHVPAATLVQAAPGQ